MISQDNSARAKRRHKKRRILIKRAEQEDFFNLLFAVNGALQDLIQAVKQRMHRQGLAGIKQNYLVAGSIGNLQLHLDVLKGVMPDHKEHIQDVYDERLQLAVTHGKKPKNARPGR